MDLFFRYLIVGIPVIGWIILPAYWIWSLLLLSEGTSPGKKVLGMVVVQEDGQPAGFWRMLLRETVGMWFSAFLFGLGFIWIMMDSDRQGWHDKMVRTYVVEGRMPT